MTDDNFNQRGRRRSARGRTFRAGAPIRRQENDDEREDNEGQNIREFMGNTTARRRDGRGRTFRARAPIRRHGNDDHMDDEEGQNIRDFMGNTTARRRGGRGRTFRAGAPIRRHENDEHMDDDEGQTIRDIMGNTTARRRGGRGRTLSAGAPIRRHGNDDHMNDDEGQTIRDSMDNTTAKRRGGRGRTLPAGAPIRRHENDDHMDDDEGQNICDFMGNTTARRRGGRGRTFPAGAPIRSHGNNDHMDDDEGHRDFMGNTTARQRGARGRPFRASAQLRRQEIDGQRDDDEGQNIRGFIGNTTAKRRGVRGQPLRAGVPLRRHENGSQRDDDEGQNIRELVNLNERRENGSNSDRQRRKLTFDRRFLRELETRNPSDVVLTLSHPDNALKSALSKCIQEPDYVKYILPVLSIAIKCDSMPENLNRIFVVMKESGFYNSSIIYFLDMQNENSLSAQKEFAQPIKDMVKIIREIYIKMPTNITQFVRIHTRLQAVIDALREQSSIIDDEILTNMRELTELKDKIMLRFQRKKETTGKQQHSSEQEEPPDDFRDIDIFPQRNDMQINNEPFLRVNKAHGAYNDVDHYLDVQFRLLREDYVGPLRCGIADYIQPIQEKGKHRRVQDVIIYHSVRVIAPICSESGLCHVLQFDISRLNNVKWAASKRLIYGSLLCLSYDSFQTFYFATVNNREPKGIAKGYIQVRFEHDMETVQSFFGRIFTMAEAPAYFEAYRHVLAALQRTHPGELPFEKYIVKCQSQVDAPSYLRRHPDTKYDLRPLVDDDVELKADSKPDPGRTCIRQVVKLKHDHTFSDESEPAKSVEVLNRDTWPTADLLHLDGSQLDAIYTALTREFAIIQGPPGTGKTYIGLKIVKALLQNKDAWSKDPHTGAVDTRPMLLVCYTNHALDQFLEGIVTYFKGDVLRIGGRGKSEILKTYNLRHFRQRFRHERNVPVAVFQACRETKCEMDSIRRKIDLNATKIQVANSNILHENVLRPVMGAAYERLVDRFDPMLTWYPDFSFTLRRNYSVIVEWLGLGICAEVVEMEKELQLGEQINRELTDLGDEPVDDLIDVENEVDVINAQRNVNDGEGDDDDDDENIQNVQASAVALDIDHIGLGERPKSIREDEWQIQKKEKKNLKRKAQKQLASLETMTDEEVNAIQDLWRIGYDAKWKIYRLWVQKYRQTLLGEIATNEAEFEAASARYQEALMQEDKAIMQQATVIGMTTTGAARYQSVLQEIRPRIIVVEEAAEVYEAHIVTTLSRGCEHVILIGDHKQLKPKPTVYKLATDYNLDISLFERMVTNGMSCDCLEVQHRMRPEIAVLLRHIYDNLRDHDDVFKYENIKGVSSNIFCVKHSNAEEHDEDPRSHSNNFEANYIVALCKYLLLQGYKPSQITVLTMYSGQLFCLRSLMPKSEFDGVHVTVVDNYQGEENDIILLSLVRSNEDGNIGFLKIDNRVCVALSRAKLGFYLIGNFECLSRRSDLWKEITIDMKKKRLIGAGLQLYCQNHPDNDGILVKQAGDFAEAPQGGCNKKCNTRLKCGHVCQQFCHVIDREHEYYNCPKPCAMIVCYKNHKCRKMCYEKCGNCTRLVRKLIPRCKHIQNVECHLDPSKYSCTESCTYTLRCGHQCQALCGEAHTRSCMEQVEKTWSCGHYGTVACHEQDKSVCNSPCGIELKCGDVCLGTCGSCFQGRLHEPCKRACRRIIVCGHECEDNCNNCPPCQLTCDNKCIHSSCRRKCGALCVPCNEPCAWKCAHYTCSRLCSEPCDRPRCNQPCEKRLTCGHPCIGLCGEPCPTDCRICDNEKVSTMLFGNEDEPDARFVLLQDCNHIVEAVAMDRYMDTEKNTEHGVVTIQLKGCPMCNTPIRKSFRYGNMINESLQNIEAVKRKMLGSSEKIGELEKTVKVLIDSTSVGLIRRKRMIKYTKTHKNETTLTAISNQIKLVNEINEIEANMYKLHSVAILDQQRTMGAFLWLFRDWILEERNIMTDQEIEDAQREIARCQSHVSLMTYQKSIQSVGMTIDGGLKRAIQSAERLLTDGGVFTDEKEALVKQCLHKLKKLKLTGLGITDTERVMIIAAVGLKRGHWYKCPNGHVYAIGDCGGANQGGTCPECKVPIGGVHHSLAPGNAPATEMDGAKYPAYSDEANLAIGFNIVH